MRKGSMNDGRNILIQSDIDRSVIHHGLRRTVITEEQHIAGSHTTEIKRNGLSAKVLNCLILQVHLIIDIVCAGIIGGAIYRNAQILMRAIGQPAALRALLQVIGNTDICRSIGL